MVALKKILIAAAAACGAAMTAQVASAAVIGVAVNQVGPGAAPIAGAVFNPGAGPDGGNGLGAPAIGFYIPLGNASGTFGVAGFGQSADSGDGGGALTMILRFSGVQTGTAGVLNIIFQDLDLVGVNDPTGFFETLQVVDAADNPLTGVITDIGGLVIGDTNSQELVALALASTLFTGPDLFLKLRFKSSFTSKGTNTAEYLIAQVNQVPTPAALPLFLAGIAGLSFARGRAKAA